LVQSPTDTAVAAVLSEEVWEFERALQERLREAGRLVADATSVSQQRRDVALVPPWEWRSLRRLKQAIRLGGIDVSAVLP
jgi:hypothetical protein